MPTRPLRFLFLASLLFVTGFNVGRADNETETNGGTATAAKVSKNDKVSNNETKRKSFTARALESFTKVVHEKFPKWDQDRDGWVSANEIDRLIADPAVVGLEAAAVAAIHRYLRSDGAPAALTQQDLLTKAQQQPALAEEGNQQNVLRTDLNTGKPRFVTFYSRFATHLKKAPRDLFSEEDGPTLTGIQQGSLGDCFFMCVIGAAVNRNPQAVRKMFRANDDGTADVMFPGAGRVHVDRLTDGEIALTSSAADQGIWVNVLEKAFSTVKSSAPKTRQSEDDIDLDSISRGGKILTTIQLMTGRKAYVIKIRKYKNKKYLLPAEDEMPRMMARLDSCFSKAFASNRLVCADIAPGVKGKDIPPGLVGRHAYAILGYDQTSQIVTVWNPHGKDYTPKQSPAGVEHGYKVKGGIFQIPLDEFVRVFKAVTYETSAPLPRA